MKRRIYHILFLVLFSVGVSASSSTKGYGYKGAIKLTPERLEQVGDSLYVAILFDLDHLKVRERRAVKWVPQLVGSKKKQELPSILIQGRLDHLNTERRLELMGRKARAAYAQTAPLQVVKGFGKGVSKQTIRYEQTLPFRSWMVDARLDIEAYLIGCGSAPKVVQFHTLNNVSLEPPIAPYQIVPVLSYVQPQAEAIKRRELVAEAFLDFVVNKTDIRPDYMNNPRELKKITDLLRELYSDSTISIRSINVVGYASPEGSYAGNRRLSEGRAQALVGYLSYQFSAPRGVYRVSYGGENWQGLKQAVDSLAWFEYRTQVLDLLTPLYPDVDAQQSTRYKRQIAGLGRGEPYRYLLKEVYPSLRKAICKIDFVIRGFEVDLARRVIKTKPQNLSLNEMFLVANTYPSGSDEFVEVFDIAVRLYPNDPIANLNAASAALERGDVGVAERYLGQIKGAISAPDLDNARGVLAMLQGDYERAEILFQAAASAGLVAAQANLDELAKKRENIELIKQQQERWTRSDD